MNKIITFMIAVWTAMTACLYGATFAEAGLDAKIACGIAFAILYVSMILAPYFVAKRKGSKETLVTYCGHLLITNE